MIATTAPPTKGQEIPGPPETLTVVLTVAQARAVRAAVTHIVKRLEFHPNTLAFSPESAPRVGHLSEFLAALERAGGEG